MRPEREGSRHDLRALTAERTDFLTWGFGWCDPKREPPFESEDEAARAWRIHGPAIMAEWGVPFRRPCGWWMERGEPDAGGIVDLLELDELTPAETHRLPGTLTPSLARQIVGEGLLGRLPGRVAEQIAGYRGLFTGLTKKGRDELLDGLDRTSWRTIMAAQALEDGAEHFNEEMGK